MTKTIITILVVAAVAYAIYYFYNKNKAAVASFSDSGSTLNTPGVPVYF